MRAPHEKLAARYGLLLDFYPRAYRARRGAELVATLLECARPGQRWPSVREARALVVEGLRMRAGTAEHRPVRVTLAGGIQATVLLLLAISAVGGTLDALTREPVTRGPGWWLLFGFAVPAMVVPFVLVALGRVRLALPFVAVAGVAGALLSWLWYDWISFWFDLGLVSRDILHSTVALLGTAALCWLRPGRATRTLLLWVVVPVVIVYLPGVVAVLGLTDPGGGLGLVQFVLLIATYLGVLAYAAVDARPAMMVTGFAGLLFLYGIVISAMFRSWPALLNLAIVFVVALLPGIAAWAGTRRLARIPAMGPAPRAD